MDNCCDDSPLSIAGNIVGFLTFLLAAVAWIVALIATTRGAPEEIKASHANIEIAIRQIEAMLSYCHEQSRSKDALFNLMDQDFTRSLEDSVAAAEILKTDLAIHTDVVNVNGGTFDLQLRRRIRWVAARDDIDRRMSKLSVKKADITAFQLTLLLR